MCVCVCVHACVHLQPSKTKYCTALSPWGDDQGTNNTWQMLIMLLGALQENTNILFMRPVVEPVDNSL